MSEPIVAADKSIVIKFTTKDSELARSMSGPYMGSAEAFRIDDGSWFVEMTFRPQVEPMPKQPEPEQIR